eukprot:Skav219401  [mRNA]  locus=scaffold1139:41944:46931:+ [translate_table: standard]
MKRERVAQGHGWPNWLTLAIKDAIRACARGQGPDKFCPSLDLRSLGNVQELQAVAGGPSCPVEIVLLFALFACREMEAALRLVKQVGIRPGQGCLRQSAPQVSAEEVKQVVLNTLEATMPEVLAEASAAKTDISLIMKQLREKQAWQRLMNRFMPQEEVYHFGCSLQRLQLAAPHLNSQHLGSTAQPVPEFLAPTARTLWARTAPESPVAANAQPLEPLGAEGRVKEVPPLGGDPIGGAPRSVSPKDWWSLQAGPALL